MTVEAMPGDVLLFQAHAANASWISQLIGRITNATYSHSAVALGGDRYSHANSEGIAADGLPNDDVVPLPPSLLTKVSARRQIDMFRPGSPLDAARAMAFAEASEKASRRKGGGDPEVFSVGALAGLALLRYVASDKPFPFPLDRDRLRRALVSALDDGQRRLFCSEYVYRVSVVGGFTPELPADPFLPDPILSWIGPEGAPFQLLLRWLEWWFAEKLDIDRDALMTVREVIAATELAYECNEPRTIPVDRANFFTPRDFEASPAYTTVATWTDGRWGDPRDVPHRHEPDQG